MKSETLTTIAESQEFKGWFAKHHPFDWWAKEREGVSLPHFDRVLVRRLCSSAYEAALNAERERAAKIAEDYGTAAYRERQKQFTAKSRRELIVVQDTSDAIAKEIRGTNAD